MNISQVIILQDCKHQNIVAYMGSYLSKERLWITMEMCSGGLWCTPYKHILINTSCILICVTNNV